MFPTYRRQMKGVDWGGLYEHLKDESLDPEWLDGEVVKLMMDDDVDQARGNLLVLAHG